MYTINSISNYSTNAPSPQRLPFRRIFISLTIIYIVLSMDSDNLLPKVPGPSLFFTTDPTITKQSTPVWHISNGIKVPNYGVAISSCERYFMHIPRLLTELVPHKPSYVKLLFIVGGSTHPGVEIDETNGVTIVNVTYLGFDVLALQWLAVLYRNHSSTVNDYGIESIKYWFSFHDTVTFHENFYRKLETIMQNYSTTSSIESDADTRKNNLRYKFVQISRIQPMNMGFTSIDYLLTDPMQKVLSEGMEYDNNLEVGKTKAIDTEFRMMRLHDATGYYLSSRYAQCIITENEAVRVLPSCATNQLDLGGQLLQFNLVLHYFPELDLTKVQQNHGLFPDTPRTYHPIDWSLLDPYIFGWRDSVMVEVGT